MDSNPYRSPTEPLPTTSSIRVVQAGQPWVRLVRLGLLAVFGFLAMLLLTVTFRGGLTALVLLSVLLITVSVGLGVRSRIFIALLVAAGGLNAMLALTARVAMDVLALAAAVGLVLGVVATRA